MEEEVTNRTVNLAVNTTKLTVRTIMNAIRNYCNRHRRKVPGDDTVQGKQTVKQLIGQGQGVSSIPIADTELKGFQRVAKKYGVDFAIRRDDSRNPPRYTVFFKAKDADALTAAYKEYSAQLLKRQKRPSVLKKLSHFAEIVAARPRKVREKQKERDR